VSVYESGNHGFAVEADDFCGFADKLVDFLVCADFDYFAVFHSDRFGAGLRGVHG
jgi:hypothetical protein